jgi:Arc/MetJ-type ribon-helix-helix transcriptional regulator
MVMDTLQVRMEHKLVSEVDGVVKSGFYSSRAEVIRDAVRRFMWERQLDSLIGIIPNKGDSVKEIRAIRRKLSKQNLSLEELNRY